MNTVACGLTLEELAGVYSVYNLNIKSFETSVSSAKLPLVIARWQNAVHIYIKEKSDVDDDKKNHCLTENYRRIDNKKTKQHKHSEPSSDRDR